MTATPSTLRTFRIGGQIDPAWAGAIPWTQVRATATLATPTDGTPILDPSNGAHEHPLTTSNTLTAAVAGGQWSTTPLKPTTAANVSLALQPTGLYWTIDVALQWGQTWQPAGTYTVQLSGDRNYSALGETVTVNGQTCADVVDLLPPPSTTVTTDVTGITVLVWDGNAWTTDANVAVYIRRTGDPAPTGLNSNDIVIRQQ